MVALPQRRRAALSIACALVALTASTDGRLSSVSFGTALAAQAAGPAPGLYELVAVHSGKCVDVSTISTAPGALVHQWTCDTGSTLTTKKNQIWRLSGKS